MTEQTERIAIVIAASKMSRRELAGLFERIIDAEDARELTPTEEIWKEVAYNIVTDTRKEAV